MAHQKMCDYCGKESLDLTFHLPEDEAGFTECGEMPGPYSIHEKTISVGQGKVFYLSRLGIVVVVCDKCLESKGWTVILQSLANDPKLVEKVISNLVKEMAKDRGSLNQKMEELRELQKRFSELEEEIKAKIKSLSARGSQIEFLTKRLSKSEVLEES